MDDMPWYDNFETVYKPDTGYDEYEILHRGYEKEIDYSKYSSELLALKESIHRRNNQKLNEDIKLREFTLKLTHEQTEEARAANRAIIQKKAEHEIVFSKVRLK